VAVRHGAAREHRDRRWPPGKVYDANAWRASDGVLRQVLQADRWDVVALGGITRATLAQAHRRGGARRRAARADRRRRGVLTSMPHDIMRLIPQIDVAWWARPT